MTTRVFGLTVGDVCTAMEAIAPLRLAQEWDNVGLLVGDRAAACRRVLLCIDTTPAVLAEAARLRCEMIVSYHPLIFRAVKHLRADSPDTDATAFEAIRRGIAVYSPHTALDAADGGTNDVLAGLCGLGDAGPFEFVAGGACGRKVVVFVPAEALDRVAGAMFAAGAGRIGEYEQCSYRLRGEGTFFGTDATNPAVGRKGRLERVEEIRLEMVAPPDRVPEVVAAIRASHPYETPAYDIYPLDAPPVRGIGRVGSLPPGTTLGALARLLKRRIGIALRQNGVRNLLPRNGPQRASRRRFLTPFPLLVGDPKTRLRRAAICVGAAGRLPLDHRRSADADVIITGEIRHHDALTFLRMGRCAIALGHWESERPMLPVLANRLSQQVGESAAYRGTTHPARSAAAGIRTRSLETIVSRVDVAPFQSA